MREVGGSIPSDSMFWFLALSIEPQESVPAVQALGGHSRGSAAPPARGAAAAPGCCRSAWPSQAATRPLRPAVLAAALALALYTATANCKPCVSPLDDRRRRTRARRGTAPLARSPTPNDPSALQGGVGPAARPPTGWGRPGWSAGCPGVERTTNEASVSHAGPDRYTSGSMLCPCPSTAQLAVSTFLFTNTCERRHTHTHTHTQSRTRTHTRARARTRTRTRDTRARGGHARARSHARIDCRGDRGGGAHKPSGRPGVLAAVPRRRADGGGRRSASAPLCAGPRVPEELGIGIQGPTCSHWPARFLVGTLRSSSRAPTLSIARTQQPIPGPIPLGRSAPRGRRVLHLRQHGRGGLA
jgi:hypothetical protein